MLSLRPLTNAKQAAVYYERDDYYVDGMQVAPSAWWGEGATRLRLKGPVDREAFRELLEGRLPNGAVLEGGRTGKHRPGLDLTFSAPKSVSIAALVGGDERIVKAHDAAVTAALRYLQQTTARARNAIGGTTRLEQTNNLVVARFVHDTSRALDPQLHTHAVVLNVTRRSDGQWRALANEELFRSKMIGGAIYRAELARKLRTLGYEPVRTHADGRFEISGVGEKELAEFSKRRAQIVAHLEERGLDGHRAADAAARATRDKKQDIDRGALRQEWKNVARQMGLEVERMRGPVHRARAGETRMVADEVLGRSLDRLTERDVVVSEKRLLEGALNLGVGTVKLDDVRRALSRKVEHGELVAADSRRSRDPFIQHFTTDRELANEQALLDVVERGRGRMKALATKREIARTLNAIDARGLHPLSKGQAEAIELALSTTDQVVGIQGYAGTGKTTGALLHIRRFAEERGLEVRGFAPTAAAAAVLTQDAEIETMTIARFLRSERTPAMGEKDQVWIIDEASMMSNRDARTMLERAEQAGAPVVLVGDRDQLPSIEAGRAFGLLQDRGIRVARMESVVRQKDEGIRKAVVATIGREHGKALDQIAPHVTTLGERVDRLAAIASAYASLPEAERDAALVLTGSNADREELNAQIRSRLARAGAIRGDHEARILVARDFTKDEKKDALHYRDGDVVRFGRSYRTADVKSGEVFFVERVNATEGTIELRHRDGRTRTWRPARASRVEVYEVARRDLAAGDRIRFTRNDRKQHRHNGLIGRVVAVDAQRRTAEVLAGGRRHVLDLDQAQHFEHAYASTVHAAQGRTADRVLMHIDTAQAHLAGHEAWYVALSRARKHVQVFTDDSKKLPEVIRKSLGQEAALDVARPHAELRRRQPEPVRVQRTEEPRARTRRPSPVRQRKVVTPTRTWMKGRAEKTAAQLEREHRLGGIGPGTYEPKHTKERSREKERKHGYRYDLFLER